MLLLWDDYVRNNNVILPNRTPFEGLYDALPARFPVDNGYPPLLNKRQYTPPAELMTTPKQ
jgi:arylsulfatase